MSAQIRKVEDFLQFDVSIILIFRKNNFLHLIQVL